MIFRFVKKSLRIEGNETGEKGKDILMKTRGGETI